MLSFRKRTAHVRWITGLILFGLTAGTSTVFSAFIPNPPSSPVSLIFIHHSVGENWLADSNGKLGITLRNNNYFVSDTNYHNCWPGPGKPEWKT